MLYIIKANCDILKTLSDDDVRKYCKDNLTNGEYITMICKNCGVYKLSIYASTDNCEIKNECDKC